MNDYNEQSFRLSFRPLLSINDPRWGRGEDDGQKPRPNESKRPGGNNDGPPDLEEMWREFNRRLSSLWGSKLARKGPGSSEKRPPNPYVIRIGIGIVIGVLIAIYFASGLFIVQQGQVGVVLRLGQYRSTVEPGLHVRLPYPFEASEIVDTAQIRSVEMGRDNVVQGANVKEASMLTRDGGIVDVRFIVQYQIKSPTDYLFHTVNPDRIVIQTAQAAMRDIVGARDIGTLLDQDPDAIHQQLMDAIVRALEPYHTGLVVTGVTLEDIKPPEQTQAAFDDIARARQDRESAKRDAQAAAKAQLARVRDDAARMVDDANAYAQRVVTQAQGDAERFKQVYAQYLKAPVVVRERMYLETMQEIYSNTTKVFVDSKTGNNVLNLTLDKMMNTTRPQSDKDKAAAASAASSVQGGASSVASGASDSASSASQAAVTGDPLRSREAFRSRIREDDLN